MSDRRPGSTPVLPYEHLSIIPETVGELLFVTFELSPPNPNLAIIGVEAFEQDATTIALATLGQVGLVSSITQMDAINRTLRSIRIAELEPADDPYLGRLNAARERYQRAVQMLSETEQELLATYYDKVDGGEHGDSRIFNSDRFGEVIERTKRFSSEPALVAIAELGHKSISGLANREVVTAQRVLRLAYSTAAQLKQVKGQLTSAHLDTDNLTNGLTA